MTDHKKPGVAFWSTAVMVVALVGYPLCFGPACWISSRTGNGADAVNAAYQPMLHLVFCGHPLVRNPLSWYGQLWARDNWTVGYVSGRYEWGVMPL